MKSKVNILLAEDDTSLGYILSEYLKMNGFNVKLAINGKEAMRIYQNHLFDICIFDIMMPEMDGFTLAEKIRDNNADIPIIFLTAKTLKIDKLKAFNIGADDYIVKPVDEEELIARIKAIIRRSGNSRGKEENKISNLFQIGLYSFDAKNQSLSIDNDRKDLTTKETEILKILCERNGQIVERNRILNKLWGESDYFNRKSMDVFIYKLRKYLSKDPRIKIKNVHGKGFILIED